MQMGKINLIGQIFGYWKVLDFDVVSIGTTHPKWICLCTNCGKTKSVYSHKLRSGESTSCGCTSRRKNIDGQTFGNWKVIGYDDEEQQRIIQCVKCGEIRKTTTYRLLHKSDTIFCNSCKYYRNTRWHGCSALYPSEFSTYRSMISRCYNKNDVNYPYYGGRSIFVCDEWIESFEIFVKDMGLRPEGKTLDRKDFNGNYEPDNCRWADWKVQANNRSNNVYETINDITLTKSQWINLIDISRNVIEYRMRKQNMNFEEALFKDSLINIVERIK
jgi:hypothetical protein